MPNLPSFMNCCYPKAGQVEYLGNWGLRDKGPVATRRKLRVWGHFIMLGLLSALGGRTSVVRIATAMIPTDVAAASILSSFFC
jgi:hypothetical protein